MSRWTMLPASCAFSEAEARLAAQTRRTRSRRHRAEARDEVLDVLADEELHDEVRAPGRRVEPRVEHLGDVLRLDRAARHRLAPEALDDLGRLREDVPGDHLDRAPAPGAGVASLVDGAHSPLAELPDELVLAVQDRQGRSGGVHAVSSRRAYAGAVLLAPLPLSLRGGTDDVASVSDSPGCARWRCQALARA